MDIKKVASAPGAQLSGGFRIADSDKLETDYKNIICIRDIFWPIVVHGEKMV